MISGLKVCLLITASSAVSCSGIKHEATKAEIEASAKRIVGSCLPPSAHFASRIRQESDGIWRVEVQQIDPRHTNCGCILFVPDSGHEMLFKPSGKLISDVPSH